MNGEDAVKDARQGVKRFPIPATFLVVAAATVFLIIFFGAWAVSADVDEQDRKLSFGFANRGASTDASPLDSAQSSPTPVEAGEDSTGDTWWGKAFLTACPLH
ncbi:MAG: hypothetical protein QF714_05685 [Dehalococcoidia bacterium]|jgi:hypothetical protein|nr:hypothetical protein [Dehalococcoidia bacterium]MDP7083815.1 hypothetical protein [Dehalococcoidia bacterium]MDP7201081.1 hypothetical protein [Dehalococcoidia bacterium]HJN87800.1 hypothetical protein [Dehalococcoidia bacterium]|tara:strand:- start:212 stop:520 length:309 start_codon:yes stop_codon:yes gene_type:complete